MTAGEQRPQLSATLQNRYLSVHHAERDDYYLEKPMTNENEPKDDKKTVDLPPYGPRNPDPITDAPGSHPIETGVGAALGGAAAGAALGTAIGPPGVVLGTVAGAIAGGLAGKGVGELIDPTTEDNWIREWLAVRDRSLDLTDDEMTKAYRFGLREEAKHPRETFDEAEPVLRAKWESQRTTDEPVWEDVNGSARAGFEKMH